MNVRIDWKTFAISALATTVLLTSAAIVLSQQPLTPPPPGGFGGPGFRGPGGPRGPREGFGPFGPMGRELNLTDDQKSQIKQIQDSFRSSDQALFEQLRALHEKQPDPTAAFDEAAVRSAAEARAKIQVELEVSHAKMMSQIFSVLTPEQKSQLAAKHDQMRRQTPPPPPPAQVPDTPWF